MSIAPKVVVSDMIDPRFLDKIENWNDWRRTSSRFIVTVGVSCNIESFGNVGLIEMFLTTRNF